MRFIDVADASAAVASRTGRNAKVEVLAGALRQAGPELAPLVAGYLSGALPQRRTGLGWRSLAALPAPAAEPTLGVADVDAALTAITALAGSGSQAARRARVEDLFGALTGTEQEYLRGLLTGGVRQGALDGVLQSAVAQAAGVPLTAVRRAAMLSGSTPQVAGLALGSGLAGLTGVGLSVGRGVAPMLAASAPDVAAAVAQAGAGSAVAVERKVDGIRLQLHKDGDDVALFTRSLDDITARLPGIVDLLRRLPHRRLVIDAEAVSVRPDGSPEPFQVTGSRAATGDERLVTMAFDLLHLDGEDLLDLPARERFEALAGVLPRDLVVPRLVTVNPAEAQAFFDEQVAAGHEGVVVKSLSSTYQAGRRGAGWVKVKPRHTLDLVVLAVEEGSGRRRGWWSNIHLGARDGDGFVMLGKTFKGMTDEMLAWQTERFRRLETSSDGWVHHLRPEQVVEIAFDGLQRSTRYPGGVALRFARVLRYRQDKTAAQADTLETVRALARF